MSIIAVRRDSENRGHANGCISGQPGSRVHYGRPVRACAVGAARKGRAQKTMYVVSVYDVGEDKEHQAEALSSALGKTVLEARARLNAPGSGPFVVGVFGNAEAADGLAAKLRGGGFRVAMLDEEDIARETGGSRVRRFDLGEKEMRVESSGGEGRAIGYSEIDLILRGTGIKSSTSTETTTERSFSLSRAVLSSGLSVTKTTKTVREVTTQEREGFFILYAGDERPLSFRENSLIYDSLGPARQPARSANFAFLLAELRRHCPSVRCDERLLTRPRQAALLGPSLDPEGQIAVATALLSKVLRGK